MAGNPDVNVASWDIHDIYAGMNTDFRRRATFRNAIRSFRFPSLSAISPSTTWEFTAGSFAPYDLTGGRLNHARDRRFWWTARHTRAHGVSPGHRAHQ